MESSYHAAVARDDDLQRWTEAGLITVEQRAAILEHERARAAAAGAKLPAVVEVLTYLGAAAVTGAIVALLSDVWGDLGLGGQFVLLAVLSIGAGVAGAALRGPGNTPLTRASAVLWFLSVGFLGLAFMAVGSDVDPDRAWQGLLLVGGPALALSTAYQVVQPRAPQVFATFASAIVVMLGVADLVTSGLTVTGGGITAALVGAAGFPLTRMDLLTPRGVAFGLSGIALIGGTWIPGLQDDAGWAEGLSIVAAIVLLGISVPVRSPHLLIVGALGLFLTVTTTIVRHFADTIGVPVSLLFVGVLLIGSAVLVARLRPMTRAV